MMKRAMVLGTLIAAGGVYAGWVLSKRVNALPTPAGARREDMYLLLHPFKSI